VEARAYGRGHAYGTKVDCWSLGAVLYVMLVARFPEFDRSNGGMRVKLDAPAWAGVSEAAKDLIRCLMIVDPNSRYSVQQVRLPPAPWCVCLYMPSINPTQSTHTTHPQALQHPWVTGASFHGPSSAAAGLMHGMGRLAVGGGQQQHQPSLPPVPQQHPAIFDATGGRRNMSGEQQSQPPPGMEIFQLTASGDQARRQTSTSSASTTSSTASFSADDPLGHHASAPSSAGPFPPLSYYNPSFPRAASTVNFTYFTPSPLHVHTPVSWAGPA
jgi:serine/threonine protein kinase